MQNYLYLIILGVQIKFHKMFDTDTEYSFLFNKEQ